MSRGPNLRFEFPASCPAAILATGSHGGPFVHPRARQGEGVTFGVKIKTRFYAVWSPSGTYGVGRMRGRDRVPDGLPDTVTVPDGPLKFPNLIVSLTRHGFGPSHGHGHVPEG